MGYDLTMTKVKKVDLDALKDRFPNASLADFWGDQFICYLTEDEFAKEYGEKNLNVFKKNKAIFCKELVYTCKRAFRECPMIKNDENDFTIELSLEETKKLFSWLDHFVRNDYYDNIEKYYECGCDTVYLQLHLLLKEMKEDEVVIFHHDW